MTSLQVNIINPKAVKLLQNLAELNLISIKENNDDAFLNAVQRLRKKAGKNPPALEEITQEVETIREKRYAKK